MLMTVLALSSTILGATAIAGLLMLYQIRQSTDIVNSTKAIFAADSGIEWRLYKFFKADSQACKNCSDLSDPGGACPPVQMRNNAIFSTTCDSRIIGGPGGSQTVSIKSIGTSVNNSRAFEIILE